MLAPKERTAGLAFFPHLVTGYDGCGLSPESPVAKTLDSPVVTYI